MPACRSHTVRLDQAGRQVRGVARDLRRVVGFLVAAGLATAASGVAGAFTLTLTEGGFQTQSIGRSRRAPSNRSPDINAAVTFIDQVKDVGGSLQPFGSKRNGVRRSSLSHSAASPSR